MSIAQEQALTDVLVEGGAHFELLPHRHTETARAEARALGLELDEVAKTVIVRTPNGYVRVVVPASGRVDLGKLRALLGTEGVEGVIRLATESELAAAYPGFDLGAVPPSAARQETPWFSTSRSPGMCGSSSRPAPTRSRCG